MSSDTDLKILAISGSLRAGSLNTALLRAIIDVAPEGMRFDMADIGSIPHYNADDGEPGGKPDVMRLVEQVRAADGVLIATPEYNYSIPGVLKNAIDWVSRAENQPFKAKPVGIVGASMGAIGTARAQYHLRQVFVFLDAYVMNRPEVFIGAAHTKFNDEGKLTDEATRDFLVTFLDSYAAWVRRG